MYEPVEVPAGYAATTDTPEFTMENYRYCWPYRGSFICGDSFKSPDDTTPEATARPGTDVSLRFGHDTGPDRVFVDVASDPEFRETTRRELAARSPTTTWQAPMTPDQYFVRVTTLYGGSEVTYQFRLDVRVEGASL